MIPRSKSGSFRPAAKSNVSLKSKTVESYWLRANGSIDARPLVDACDFDIDLDPEELLDASHTQPPPLPPCRGRLARPALARCLGAGSERCRRAAAPHGLHLHAF